MVPREAARLVLERAAEKCGGVDGLSQRLGIHARVLKMCIEGRETVPDQLYLKAVDIVLDGQSAPPS
jgi:hypothetical protein